jgi:hypothetical protein
MNPISNLWNHPKTSVSGVLIAVITIAGVLSQQGVTLGNAGAGTMVTLLSAVATALLGLLARDPGETGRERTARSVEEAARLGVWLLILLLLPLPWMEGCSGTAVAQDIVNWTPALESSVTTVDSTAALLAPADAPIFTVATTGFDAASNLLVAQAKAYLANPGAGVLAELQTQVVAFEQQVNGALLQAGKIVNPASQQHALAAIQAVATIVTAILALVQSISSKAAVARMASQSNFKLAAVEPYLNPTRAARIVAAHYDEPVAQAQFQMAQVLSNASQAGF